MIVEKTYCFECKRQTMSRAYEGEIICYDCGGKKIRISKDWNKTTSDILAWIFIIGWIGFALFFILWLIK